MTETYERLPQTVTALQWQGGEDTLYEVETFTQPSVVRYNPDGTLIISRQDGTLHVPPQNWLVRDSAGAFVTFSNLEFEDTYALPVSPPAAVGASARR